MGEPILDKKGNQILVEMTQYDELGETLFSLKMNEKMDTSDANFEMLTKELNKALKNYKINTCLRKIHFLAQAYQETQRFSKTYEGNPSSSVNGGEFYRGRGLLQLTHDYNYKEFYKISEKKRAY
jgi:predicted chitinase